MRRENTGKWSALSDSVETVSQHGSDWRDVVAVNWEYAKGSGHGQASNTLQKFSWRCWDKRMKLSDRITEIWTRDFLNTEYGSYEPCRELMTVLFVLTSVCTTQWKRLNCWWYSLCLVPDINETPIFLDLLCKYGRSQWPRVLRRRSTAARLLRLWVRIPPGAWMFVCCECCVLSGRGLCDELITRPEESYRLWCVVMCDLETSWMRRPWPTEGCRAKTILAI